MDMHERVHGTVKFEQPDKVLLEIHFHIKPVEKYRGKICSFGGLDVLGTLPTGSEKDVYKQVKHLICTLGDENGGFTGGTSHTILADMPLRNIEPSYKAFEKWGAFSKAERKNV